MIIVIGVMVIVMFLELTVIMLMMAALVGEGKKDVDRTDESNKRLGA